MFIHVYPLPFEKKKVFKLSTESCSQDANKVCRNLYRQHFRKLYKWLMNDIRDFILRKEKLILISKKNSVRQNAFFKTLQ